MCAEHWTVQVLLTVPPIPETRNSSQVQQLPHLSAGGYQAACLSPTADLMQHVAVQFAIRDTRRAGWIIAVCNVTTFQVRTLAFQVCLEGNFRQASHHMGAPSTSQRSGFRQTWSAVGALAASLFMHRCSAICEDQFPGLLCSSAGHSCVSDSQFRPDNAKTLSLGQTGARIGWLRQLPPSIQTKLTSSRLRLAWRTRVAMPVPSNIELCQRRGRPVARPAPE